MNANRFFIFWAIFLWSSLVCASSRGDGHLTLYSYYWKERLSIQYRKGETIVPGTLEKISHFFRSRESGKIHPIDPRLVELLDQIEDHFQVRQIEIISGYRTPEFNEHLRATGHFVAHKSYHTMGMAADIHLDEISEEALRDYAISLAQGGVGIYPANNMVHVDRGILKTWEQKGRRVAWIGEMNPDVSARITVFPERSFDKRLKKIQIESNLEIPSPLAMELFEGPGWREVATIEIPNKIHSLKGLQFDELPFGKYRLRATYYGDVSKTQWSNEFYFKKN